jgi:hypothetical protein
LSTTRDSFQVQDLQNSLHIFPDLVADLAKLYKII